MGSSPLHPRECGRAVRGIERPLVRRRFLRVPRPRASTICLGSRWCASKPLVAEVEGLNSNLVEFLPVDLPVAVLLGAHEALLQGNAATVTTDQRGPPVESASVHRLLHGCPPPPPSWWDRADDAGAAAGVTPSRAREFWHGGARDQDPGR